MLYIYISKELNSIIHLHHSKEPSDLWSVDESLLPPFASQGAAGNDGAAGAKGAPVSISTNILIVTL